MQAPLALLALLAASAGAVAGALPDFFGGGRLIAYSPKDHDPRSGPAPGPASLRADADDLYRRGFRAVTTYGSMRALTPVCRVFKRRGFATVLVGVWDPKDTAEVRSAIKLRRCADGFVVGTEGLGSGRYTRAELEAAIRRVQAATRKPVTTRETMAAYGKDSSLVELGDWVFPTAEPYLDGATHPQSACGWTVNHYLELVDRVPAGTRVILAETGLPTAGEPGLSENNQRAYLACVESRRVPFAFFAAYDQAWKAGSPVGPHWGLFRADGTPKMWATVLAPPRIRVELHDGSAHGEVANVAEERVRVVVYRRAGHWQVDTTADISRRGRWQVRVGPTRAVAALLVPRAAVLASRGPLPPVDSVRVLAAARRKVGPRR